MEHNQIMEKLKNLVEVELEVAKKQLVRNPYMKVQVMELLEVQKFVNGEKKEAPIYG